MTRKILSTAALLIALTTSLGFGSMELGIHSLPHHDYGFMQSHSVHG